MSEKKLTVCEDCKKTNVKELAEYNEPYQELHNNREVKMILCDDCYYLRTLKI